MKKILITILLLLPFYAFADFQVDLKYGSKGDDVVQLQEFLIDKGFLSGTATGNFYSLTLSAVKKYQMSKGITPISGYVGPITRGFINNDIDVPLNENVGTIQPIMPLKSEPTQADLSKKQVEILTEQLAEQKKQTLEIQNELKEIAKNTTPPPAYVPPPKPDLSSLTFVRKVTPKKLEKEDVNYPIGYITDSSISIQVKDVDGNYIPRPNVKITVTKDGKPYDSFSSEKSAAPYGFYMTNREKNAEQGLEYNKPIDGKGTYVFTIEAYGKTATDTIVVE